MVQGPSEAKVWGSIAKAAQKKLIGSAAATVKGMGVTASAIKASGGLMKGATFGAGATIGSGVARGAGAVGMHIVSSWFLYVVLFILGADAARDYAWDPIVRFTAYLLLMVVGFFHLYGGMTGVSMREATTNLLKCAVLSAYHFSGPVLISRWITSSAAQVELTAVFMFIPLWFFVYVAHPARSERLKQVAMAVYLLFLVFYGSAGFLGAAQNLAGGDLRASLPAAAAAETAVVSVKDSVVSTYKSALSTLKSGTVAVINQGKQKGEELYNATVNKGKYEAKVDSNVRESLGVSLEGVEMSDKSYEVGDTSILWGTLKVRSLDTEDETTNVALQCRVDNKGDKTQKIVGEVFPETSLQVYTYDELEFGCKIPTLDIGSYTANLLAVFDFSTLSYLKTYIADRDRIRALNREEIDFFSFYGITDKNPVALSTNGPVKLGIGLRNPPITIDRTTSLAPRLGITVHNIGGGTIAEIAGLKIGVPKPITVTTELCDYFFRTVESDDPDYNYYELAPLSFEERALKDIKQYQSFNCPLSIRGEDVEELLGGSPFVTEFVRAEVEYKYELKKSVDFSIKKPEGFFVRFRPDPVTAQEAPQCVASHGDRSLSHVFYVIGKDIELSQQKPENSRVDCVGGMCKVEVAPIIPQYTRGDVLTCKMWADDTEETAVVRSTVQNAQPRFLKVSATKAVDLVKEGDDFVVVLKVRDEDEQDNTFKVAFTVIARSGAVERVYGVENDARCTENQECRLTVPKLVTVGAGDLLRLQELTVIEEPAFDGAKANKFPGFVTLQVT